MEQIKETYIHTYVHTTFARKTEGKSQLVENKYRGRISLTYNFSKWEYVN